MKGKGESRGDGGGHVSISRRAVGEEPAFKVEPLEGPSKEPDQT